MKRNKRVYTKELLESAVLKSKNFCQVAKNLGIPHTGGGSWELIKNRCIEYKIDTSHFTGQKLIGENNPNYLKRKTTEEILQANKTQRESHKRLKRALLESGISYKCSIVGCEISEWLGQPITLDVDHIDGNWSNCKKENLRFICPNCHRQTITFGAKNKRTSGRSGDIALV